MFVNLGFASPRAGKEKTMSESMRAFGKALEGMPGLLDTFVLAEVGSNTLVGVSIWRDREAFDNAMKAVKPPPPPEPIEQLRSAPPIVRQFESI
ncbi:MAG: antibiotic biosynthesis monooxygenase [Thaumarchaeota archaeon]|nr:antibiotic biosynthesis monooxygenase [Nitrososphaerota archaeon]